MNKCYKCGTVTKQIMCPICTQNDMLERQYNKENYGTEYPTFWMLVELVKNTALFILWVLLPPQRTDNKAWYVTKWVLKVTLWILVILYMLGRYGTPT
jgi:hypothetical protein